VQCPDGSCRYSCRVANIMRRHFLFRHPFDELHVVSQPGYIKCPSCGMMVKGPTATAKHLTTELCQAGSARQQARELQRKVQCTIDGPPNFSVGEQRLTQESEFRYLGRVITRDDSDLAAVLRNVARARTKWAAVSRILRRDGASVHLRSRFYMVIVSAVLLYGSETWVITRRIQALIDSFHNRVARTVAGTFIRKLGGDGDDEWVYPSVADTLKSAHLQPATTYLDRRRLKFRDYAETRGSYQDCRSSETRTYNFPTLWDQLDSIITPASP
jgi:hypothetical protein